MRAAVFLAVVVCALSAAASSISLTSSAWTATTTNAGVNIVADPDWEPPSLGTAVVAKSTGGIAGYIRQNSTYYIYANVTDGGNPASGTSSVTAGASSMSFGQSSASLSAGSFSAQGVSYNRRSALLTANTVLLAGAYATTITSNDAAGNDATVTGPPATVDNTKPLGSSVHTTNGGAIAGRPDAGDRLTYSWTEQLDPYASLANWTGAATAVRVLITNSGTSDDSVVVRTVAGVTLPFGTIDLNDNFVAASATFEATMTQSGSVITVTLGALVSGTPSTDTSGATTSWATGSPVGATDRAGNALTGSTITESGAADYEF